VVFVYFIWSLFIFDCATNNVDVAMEPHHDRVANVPCDKAAAQNIATAADIETNGKCPEQLEMMIVKDGVPHVPVRDAKEYVEVLNLGCNCRQRSTLRGMVVMVIMLLTNMLNYMDRFTIVGRLKSVLLVHYKLLDLILKITSNRGSLDDAFD